MCCPVDCPSVCLSACLSVCLPVCDDGVVREGGGEGLGVCVLGA